MKTKIKNLVKSALLGVAVLGLAVGVSAFGNKFADNTWFFTSDNPSEITDASKWSLTDPNKTGCDDQIAELPCDLNTPSTVNTQMALQAHFQSEYQGIADNIKSAANTLRKVE